MKNSYTRAGVSFDLSHNNTLKKRIQFITKHTRIGKDMKFLEVGSGLGMYIDHFSPEVGRYVGIDVNEEYIEKTKNEFKEDNIEILQMEAKCLSFKDNVFDVVLMIEVLEHVNDDVRAISEIFRVLKPGGKLIVTAPNKLFPLETHGLRIGTKIYGSYGLGYPILPWLPEFIRKKVANAKVYTPINLKNILGETGFLISSMEFIGPNFDVLNIRFPKYKIGDRFSNFITRWEKNSFFKKILTTIIIVAEKRKIYE